MTAFYNEHDPYAAQYLRNLMAAGLIAPGVVDSRDIQEIEAWELVGFTQVHMFAGIGIWSGALRAAGWPDDEPIWTGSCPCQPFSNAGKKEGFSDARHLWPFWRSLIAECRPPRVVGEQVASKDGRIWLDIVSAEMEALGFAFGAADLCAAGFGGAHIRQRNYFVGLGEPPGRGNGRSDEPTRLFSECGVTSTFGGLADTYNGQRPGIADSEKRFTDRPAGGWEQGHGGAADDCAIGGLADTVRDGAQPNAGNGSFPQGPIIGEYRDSSGAGPSSRDGRSIVGLDNSASARCIGSIEDAETASRNEARLRVLDARRSASPNFTLRDPGKIDRRWLDADWLLCRNLAGEPSWRPVESGTFPLAHGITDRMGKLRAIGNALDFETAKNFCEVVAEICIGL